MTHAQSADDYQRAFALYEAGKHKEALEQYRALAEHGSVDAQVFVGWMYQRGLGATANREEARRWYKKAAEAKSAEAIFYLGKLHFADKQYADALRHFEDATKQNYAPAIYRLGRMYELGKGVGIDERKAYEHFERAAQLGHLFAQRAIAGRMIKGSYGITKIPQGLYRLFKTLWDAAKVANKDEHDERIRT
jgi:TPR repeat protein